jgi:hypothetical protein
MDVPICIKSLHANYFDITKYFTKVKTPKTVTVLSPAEGSFFSSKTKCDTRAAQGPNLFVLKIRLQRKRTHKSPKSRPCFESC